MTNPVPVPVSQFPDAGALTGTEVVGVVKNGVTSRTTTQDIADLSSEAVSSVNGQTGVVVLSATDVGALPSNAIIPIAQGGTNLTAYSQGDLIYASAINVLARLAKDTNATRYLSNTGVSNAPAWAQINLANGVTGTLPIANGGTGAVNANAALNALLPAQTAHAGEFLTTDGTDTSWAPAGGAITEPENQIVYGTGVGVDSSNLFEFIAASNELRQYGMEAGFVRFRQVVMSNTTTDDTPTLLYMDPVTTTPVFVATGVDTGAVWGLRIIVSAINSISGSEAATFHIEATLFFSAITFSVTILGANTKVARTSAGASTWDANLIVDGAVVAIEVTGEVGIPIQWGAVVEGTNIGASVA